MIMMMEWKTMFGVSPKLGAVVLFTQADHNGRLPTHGTEGHVQLAMCEEGPREVQPHHVQCLSLGLVDGHCKARPDGKLLSDHHKGEVGVPQVERDSWEEYCCSLVAPCQYLCLHHSSIRSCTVGQ